MKMVHGLKIVLSSLSLFFLLTFPVNGKTLKVDTVTPSITNGDFTITPNGTGDIVLGTFSGVLKASTGVVSVGNVNLTSEVTGVLPVANGGTNSSTALSNNLVMISSAGSIVEDSNVSVTELNYLDGLTSAIVELTGAQTISGVKNFSSELLLDHIATPSNPASGKVKLYTKNDDKVYKLNSTGVETEIGAGGGGGSRLNLIIDGSFETDVSEGTCTGCTASQETSTSIVQVTDTNSAALKMAFSASSGDYTDTTTTGAQFANVSSKVSAWIKTSASDCHLVEMVDGAESQTVAVSSADEWKLYEIYGTTGATSYGYRVECNTSITDDVYVDEVYAGPVTEPIFDISQAQHWGSVKWATTTNCAFANTTTGAWNNYAIDADCDDNARTIRGLYNSTSGDAANSDGQLPQIKFSHVPAGVLKCEAKGFFYRNASGESLFRFSDGTNSTNANNMYFGGTGDFGTNTILGEFNYTTAQTGTTTIQIQSYPVSTGSAEILINASPREFEISCYHYPSPQKVFVSKCDGLECENTFSAKIAANGTVSDEGVNWINGNCTNADPRVCTLTTGLVSSAMNCSTDIDQVTASSTSSISIDNNINASFITCTRGSDYNQFDQRFVPVEGLDTEGYRIDTGAGFGSTNTAIPYFTNERKNNISHWGAVANDSTNGWSFTAGSNCESCEVTACYSALFASAVDIGWSKNSSQLTTSIVSITDSDRLSGTTTNASGFTETTCFTEILTNGDIIRPHSTASSTVAGAGRHSITMSVRPAKLKAFIGNLTPTEFVQTPGSVKPVIYSFKIGQGTVNTNCTSSPCGVFNDIGSITTSVTRSAMGIYVANLDTTKYTGSLNCTCSAHEHGANGFRHCGVLMSSTQATIYTGANSAGVDSGAYVMCHGVR